MHWLLQNKVWDLIDKTQDAPWDESDKIITLSCLSIVILCGSIFLLCNYFPDNEGVKIFGRIILVVFGIPILVGIILGGRGLTDGP